MVESFFVEYGQKTFVKKIGIFLYKISSFIALKYLIFKLPKIKTVYSMSKINEDWFRVGISDIDLIIVFSDIDNLQMFDYCKKIFNTIKKMKLVFPFITFHGPLEEDFRFWYSINMEYFYNIERNRNLSLLYGPDLRPHASSQNKIKLSAFATRLFFEEILVEIYYNILNKKDRFRNSYKFFKLLSQIGYSVEKNKIIPFHSKEMKEWLLGAGAEPQFIRQLLQIPTLDFIVNDKNFPINLIYNANIIVKYIGQKSKSKKTPKKDKFVIGNFPKIKKMATGGVENFIKKISQKSLYSIFMTKSVFAPQANSYNLYLIIGNKNKDEIKRQIRDILDNIKFLNVELKNIQKKVRCEIYLDSTFPLILFTELLNFSQFINGGFLNELPNIQYNSLVLLGAKPKLTLNYNDLTEGIYDIIHISFSLMDDSTFDTVFIYLLQYCLLIKTKKLYLDDVINIYNKIFKETIDLKNREVSYLKYRELIKNFYKKFL